MTPPTRNPKHHTKDTNRPETLPVVVGPSKDHGSNASTSSRPSLRADIGAQSLGGGEKRGLKGGKDTRDRARSTYLASEYSGPYDRRPRTGRLTRTDI